MFPMSTALHRSLQTVLLSMLDFAKGEMKIMKNIYETPVAEVISLTALEQLASLDMGLDLEGNLGVGSREDLL